MFNNQIIAGAAGQGGSFYPYSIDNSVRMSDASNSQIYWSAGTPSSGNIWTASFWFKKWSVGAGQAANEMFSAGSGGAAYMFWSWDSSDKFTFQSTADGNKGNTTGSPVFKDVSAWSHMVIRADTTQSTQADRLRVYHNGTQITTWGTDSIGTSAWDYINASGFNQYWGGASGIANANPGCNFYLADINFCDGQSYEPTQFGEVKEGIWVPIDPSVTYGNNGYRLEFKQTGTGADANGIGADTSGNDNHFTVAGVAASDVVSDSPTNSFCTMNPLATDYISQITFAEGNLKCQNSTVHKSMWATFAITSGKWYWEADSAGSNRFTIGLSDANNIGYKQSAGTNNIVGYTPSSSYSYGDAVGIYAGTLRKNGSTVASSLGYSTGDKMAIAFDADAGKVWFRKNGTWYNGSGTDSTTLDSSNHDTTVTTGETYVPVFSLETPTTWAVNFGQDSANVSSANADENGIGTFEYAVPSGFLALCTANLPEPTIGPNSEEQADDYFNTVLYTGNSGTLEVNGLNFQPDFLWIKRRDSAQNFSNGLLNSVTGIRKGLISNRTDAEFTSSGTNDLQSFDNDGFTIGQSNQFSGNDNGGTFVAWSWKAGGTAVSNTDGSITSSVSAAPDAGFSICTYTGTSTVSESFGHGLNQAPELVITKARNSSDDWRVHGSVLGTHKFLSLSGTGAVGTDSTNGGFPDNTDTLVNLGYESTNGTNYVAYCFHSSDICKVGSYVGNGSANGTFVYTGFRPAWILWKKSSATAGWFLMDSARDTFNVANTFLRPNASDAEGTAANSTADFLSNGFKLRGTGGDVNTNGATYIYLAFAEAPLKYVNAR